MGATVGKVLGMEYAQKGGVGTASITMPNGACVGVIVAVNALGDVLDNGFIVAGAHKNGAYIGTSNYLMQNPVLKDQFIGTNTTIGVVATNVALSKDDATKLAQVAHDGLARAIDPIHTASDGDTMFAMSYGDKKADMNALVAAVIEVTRRAVVNAVTIGVKP
ncbi:MAG: P1 family peptidase, partial [Christensenellaceae bacterium]